VLIIWRLPYARVDGSARARPVVERVTATDILVASVFGIAPLALCGALAVGAMIAAIVTTGLLGVWFARRIGGYTGDTLGATQQITEAVFYLTMLAIWNSR
jgi:adenosylcobinamide-GDP ribazoletransferase